MAVYSMSPVSRSIASDPASILEQEVRTLAASAEARTALDWFRKQEAEFVRWQLEAAQIAAPPFGENARADWLARKLVELGLSDVRRDGIGNVVALKPGSNIAPVLISAHIDTVFPAGTPLNIRQQGRKLFGAGISDNAAGVTALLALAAAFIDLRIPHLAPLLFVGNVGEEGEGDLRGMRHIFYDSEWKDAISACVVIDGAGTDTIISEALGSRRFEVVVRGPGGHSWSDFGVPNPIVALARAIYLFSQTRVATSPKTTFNIGVIGGGTSVNSIPEAASMRVDVRSTSGREIERLEFELRRAVDQAITEEIRSGEPFHVARQPAEMEPEIRIIGSRPAGELEPNARILKIARAVDALLGNTAQAQRASTDANIPISMGREAIALGAGGRGGGAHTLQEWFDPTGRELGLERILLIVLALAGAIGSGAPK
jgi:acetylornithine deacetylase/succinyl-diaminopimelate desuccinylase-like protein